MYVRKSNRNHFKKLKGTDFFFGGWGEKQILDYDYVKVADFNFSFPNPEVVIANTYISL